ncbi:hypothetical protein ABZX85_24850 [Streptomyces sp. NPDC004539]|uniref:hypothetical protein n=1 Tax=Streptomyces sp. NPDC004539 TaxID=3154280 RepID=UPI00339E39FE
MICPHCQASLLRKERTGNVCARCSHSFALDPKLHGRGMHDTRIRRIAERATGSGRRKVTVTQLGYLARTANRTWPGGPASGRRRWIGCSVGLLLSFGLVPLGVVASRLSAGGLVWWAGVGLVVLGYVVARGKPYRPAYPAGSLLAPSPAHFRSLMSGDWVRTYGGLPPGIVDDTTYRERLRRQSGRVELLCPDQAVRVFLTVNGMPGRLGFRLVAEAGALSGRVPVVVLHDAGAKGLRLVAEVRERWPGQMVVDAGVPVGAVVGNRRAVVLHGPVDEWFSQLADGLGAGADAGVGARDGAGAGVGAKAGVDERLSHSTTGPLTEQAERLSHSSIGPHAEEAQRLSHSTTAGPPAEVAERPDHSATALPDWLSHLTTEQVRWLGQGWYSPVAAAPPALVESAVERAVRRARLVPLGFMSWPTSEKDGN